MNYKKSAEKIVKDYDRYMKRRTKAEVADAARKARQEFQLETQFRDVSDEILHYAVQKSKRKMDIFLLIFVICFCMAIMLWLFLLSYCLAAAFFDAHIDFVESPIYIDITILSTIIGIFGFALLCIIGPSSAELELERRCKKRLESKNETDRSAEE